MDTNSGAIPVIDLEDLPNQTSKLIKACEEWGCFRIVNHDNILPVSLMQEMKAVVSSLFDLPMEIKKRNTDVILGSGYLAPGQATPFHEALGLYDMASAEAVIAFCTQLDASPQQRETILKYAQAVHRVMMTIGDQLGEGLGLASVTFNGWPCQFRISKYNFTRDSIGSPGLDIHTDTGFLTIVQDDENVGGLEVMDSSGRFVVVDPRPGSLLLTLGDIAAVWGNGRFCNVKHRVLSKEAAIRVSIASFFLGPKEAVVEPPPELVDSAHPRLYIPMTYEDHRKLRFPTKSFAGETLALLRSDSQGYMI